MKLAEVRSLIDKLAADALSLQGFVDHDAEQAIRLALEAAFVAGVRSGLKYTSNAKFAEIFGGKKNDA